MSSSKWITPFGDKHPVIDDSAFVDVSARLIGDLVLAREVSIWPMAVLRADSAAIVMGERSAVLDLALVEAPAGHPVLIGDRTIISHGAIIHGATIQPDTLIGIGAVVLDGAEIGSGSIIGANALVTGGTKIPPCSLVLGSPGKVIRETTAAERRNIAAQIDELFQKSRQMLTVNG